MVYGKEKRIEPTEPARVAPGQEGVYAHVFADRQHRDRAQRSFGPLVDRASKTVRFRLCVSGRDLDPSHSDAEPLCPSGPGTHMDVRRIREVRVVGTFQHLVDGTDWDLLSGICLARQSYSDSNAGTIYESEPIPLAGGYFEYNYVLIHYDERVEPCWINDPCSLYRSAGGGHDNSAFVI